MPVTEEEKNRELSEAEARRLARFEEMGAQFESQGYRRSELTVGIVKANVVTLVVGLPLMAALIVVFVLLNPGVPIYLQPVEFAIFVVAYIALIVVHEFVHGLTWSFFAEHGWKDIEFGFMKKYFTPYCTCGTPLKKGPYILGALMPLIVLGIVPTAVAMAVGNSLLLLIGLIMILSAGGDVLIVVQLLRYKTHASDVLFCDHPTQAGGVVFERM